MPKIPYAEKGQEAPEATPVYEEMEKSMGVVPNLVKLVGHSGAATRGLGSVLRTYFGELSIPERLREIAYLTASRHNACTYCRRHHEGLAKRAGVSEQEIALLGPEGFESDRLDEAERAVVRFAWETSRDVEASDAAVESVKRHFSSAEIAEIAFVVGGANMIQRIGRNLGVTLEG